MPDLSTFMIYLTSALILAVTPGPGIFYVLTRSLKGGRREGVASTLGTTIGGLVHVVAAALGLSALLTTSALALSLIKYAGAAYLMYLGIRTLINRASFELTADPVELRRDRDAFRQGILTEALNPKTALFFLAFIPQFIDPEGSVILQFTVLGCLSVGLNSLADLVVVFSTGPLGTYMMTHARLRRGQQMFSGLSLMALGTYAAVTENN